MAQVKVITEFMCPGCSALLGLPVPGPTRCPRCNWQGEAYLFAPVGVESNSAESALPDDATCIHHPRKKATAICAGTGDYICSLCAVELKGQIYSTEYLNTAGKDKVGKAFDRYLPRPDSRVVFYAILPFIPYVNLLGIPLAFLWIPHGFFLYSKALKLRKEDPLFGRLMGRSRVIALPIFLSLWAVGWVVGVIAILAAVWGKNR